MRRRQFVTLVGGAAVSWPITSHAQSDKTRLIGVLIAYVESDRTARSEVAAFRGGLAKLGWTEGRSGVGWRSWGGRKAAISESNCGGAMLIRIGLGR